MRKVSATLVISPEISSLSKSLWLVGGRAWILITAKSLGNRAKGVINIGLRKKELLYVFLNFHSV